MRIEKTPIEKVQVRCEDCMKILWRYNSGAITKALFDFAEGKALFHEQRHPSHSVEVLVYEKAMEETET